MFERLSLIQKQYEELCRRMEEPDTYADPAVYARCEKEARELAPLAEAYMSYEQAGREMQAAYELLNDPEMRELAQEESCVITGRSGFFVLKDHPNKLDIFITASREHRIARVMARQDLSHELAEEAIDQVDKSRENYIKRFAGVSRYDARNYHLCLNVDGMTEDQAVDVILTYLGLE